MAILLGPSVKALSVSVLLLVAASLAAATTPAAAAPAGPLARAAPRVVVGAAAAGRGGAVAADDRLPVPVDRPAVVARRGCGGPPAGDKVAAAAIRMAKGATKAGKGPKKTPAGHAKPLACEPLYAFLTTYYLTAWRLAMHTPTAKGAFEVFLLARRHAAQYVAKHPGAKPVVVCDHERVVARVLAKVVAIMQQHRNGKGALPPLGKYRSMTSAEAAAMRKALAVPIAKPLPWWVVPKSVPMFA